MTKLAAALTVAVVLGWCLASPVQAQELKVGTWSGTAMDPGNPGRRIRPASLEVKMVADPHWRWRAGPKELLSATFAIQQGSFELSSIRLEGDTLSYAFTVSTRGERVQCDLKRQADGSYEGDCTGGNFRRHVTLSPPMDSPEQAGQKPPAR